MRSVSMPPSVTTGRRASCGSVATSVVGSMVPLLCSRLFSLFLTDQTVWYNRFMPRDGSATRERILDTAERLMTDQGYNATSLDQVVAESSSSKGAFFHHFRSKADLALQLVE